MNVMRFFVPGAEKVRQFSIRLMLTRRGAFRIDWGSFRTSPEVARQLKAAGELGRHKPRKEKMTDSASPQRGKCNFGFYYPPDIYRRFEIVETTCYGVQLYGVVEIKRIFGIRFKKRLRIDPDMEMFWHSGYYWVTDKEVCRIAIECEHRHSERKFRQKVFRSK